MEKKTCDCCKGSGYFCVICNVTCEICGKQWKCGHAPPDKLCKACAEAEDRCERCGKKYSDKNDERAR